MKRLFFLLCLLNLGYLLWQFHSGRLDIQAPESVAPSPLLLVGEYERARRGAEIAGLIDRRINRWRQADTQRMLVHLKGEKPWWMKVRGIVIAKKVSPSSDNKQAVKAVAEPVKIAAVIEKKCYEAGPFADESSVRQWLRDRALRGEKILQKELVAPRDYQVYYPAAQTLEQSKTNKAMLNAKGLQDVWLIPSGENKGAYSLGVFNDKQRALVFRDELAGRGIQAQIKQREKTTPQWSARVMLDKTKLESYRSAGVKLSACSANAENSGSGATAR